MLVEDNKQPEIEITAAGISGNGYCYEDIAMKAKCLKYFSSSLKYFEHFWQKCKKFPKMDIVYSLDTLGVENFDEITLYLQRLRR